MYNSLFNGKLWLSSYMHSPEGAYKHIKSTRVCDTCSHSVAFQQVSNRVHDHDKKHHVVS